MSGNTMNTQSCSQPQLRPKRTVAKLRAGLTEVLSIGIVIMWMSASIRPIGMPANPAMADAWVVPTITRMKSAVNTTSMMTTAQNAKVRRGSGRRSRSTHSANKA